MAKEETLTQESRLKIYETMLEEFRGLIKQTPASQELALLLQANDTLVRAAATAERGIMAVKSPAGQDWKEIVHDNLVKYKDVLKALADRDKDEPK